MSTQLHEGSTEPSCGEENILQQRLSYTNDDLKNYLFIDSGTSIPIIAWKLTKNHSHISSSTSIPDHSNNNKDDGQNQCNDVDNFEDESYDALDSLQQLDAMKSNTIVHQDNEILLTVESINLQMSL